MMRHCFAVLLALVPAHLPADPAPVISGEHAAFSRLVTQQMGEQWSVTQTGRDVILEFPDHDEGFDTAGVFERMPQTRVRAIETTKNRMVLQLNCDCAVAAFTDKGAYVVIDVAATADDLVRPAITPIPHEEAPTEAQRSRTAQLPLMGDATAATLDAGLETQSTARSPAALEMLASVEERLERELALAALRGVIDPLAGTARRSQIDPTALVDATPSSGIAPEIDSPRMNMRVSSSRDFPQTLHDAVAAIGQDAITCPAFTQIDVANWGDQTPFAAQIGIARQGLFGEFDRLDHSVARRLAQRYIYFGFGAEARDVLLLDPDLAAGAPYLMSLSHLVDGDHPGAGNAFEGLHDCDGPTVLWVTLALPDPPSGALPALNPALRALNDLPVHLRQTLAPMLSRTLLTYGDPKGATMALRSLERLPDPLAPAAKLAKARVALGEGQMAQGAQKLSEVAEQNAPQSPEALVALVDAKFQQDQPVDPQVASLVEAYAQELRDTPLGPDLRRAHVIALIRSAQFDRAYAAAANLGGNDPTAAAAALRLAMLRELTASASDIVFLDHAFAALDTDIAQLPPSDMAALAARYLTLGFADRAENILARLPLRSRDKSQNLLAARVSLARGKPFKAQADLLGETGVDADLLRAEAKRMAGEMQEARALYADAGRPEEAAEAAWLAGDLRNVLDPENASATATLPAVSANGAGMLARTAALLDQSEQARQSLSELLEDPPLQFSPTN